MISPSFIHSSFFTPTLCITTLLCLSSSSLSAVFICRPSHYHPFQLFTMSLLPSLSIFFPSLLTWPFSFSIPLCSSLKALRNYSQWSFFFSSPCLGCLSWVFGWFVRSTDVSHSGCCCQCIFPHYLTYTPMKENWLPPVFGESSLHHKHQSSKYMSLLTTFSCSPVVSVARILLSSERENSC